MRPQTCCNFQLDVVLSGGGGHVQPAATLPTVLALQARLGLVDQLVLILITEVVHRGEEPGMQFNSIEKFSYYLSVRLSVQLSIQ